MNSTDTTDVTPRDPASSIAKPACMTAQRGRFDGGKKKGPRAAGSQIVSARGWVRVVRAPHGRQVRGEVAGDGAQRPCFARLAPAHGSDFWCPRPRVFVQSRHVRAPAADRSRQKGAWCFVRDVWATAYVGSAVQRPAGRAMRGVLTHDEGAHRDKQHKGPRGRVVRGRHAVVVVVAGESLGRRAGRERDGAADGGDGETRHGSVGVGLQSVMSGGGHM